MFDASKGLAELLRPFSRDLFFTEYWEEKPLVIERQEPEFYSGLFSSEEADRILAYSEIEYPFLQAAQDGKLERSLDFVHNPLSADHPLNQQINSAYKLYSQGHTLILNRLERRSDAVRRLCRFLEAELNHPVGANAYVTPKGARGFSAHCDDHDVLILQIAGSKHWDVYAPGRALPLKGEAGELPDAGLARPHLSTVLNAGDLLYLPRGWGHSAHASEAPSLHLTVGLFVYRWVDFLSHALRGMAETDMRFRRALPPGFLDDEAGTESLRAGMEELIAAFAAQANIEAARAGMARDLWKRAVPSVEGRLADIDALAEIDLDTQLSKPAAMRGTVAAGAAVCSFHFHGVELRLPAKTIPALQFLCEQDGTFTARQIPGSLRESEVLVLVRRLIVEGFLRRAGTA